MNIHHAKTHLSKLIERVESGEEIVIARNGRPVAKLTPHRPAGTPGAARGAWKGRVDMASFDVLDAEIADEFETRG